MRASNRTVMVLLVEQSSQRGGPHDRGGDHDDPRTRQAACDSTSAGASTDVARSRYAMGRDRAADRSAVRPRAHRGGSRHHPSLAGAPVKPSAAPGPIGAGAPPRPDPLSRFWPDVRGRATARAASTPDLGGHAAPGPDRGGGGATAPATGPP